MHEVLSLHQKYAKSD